MVSRVASVLVVVSLAAPAVYAQESTTNLRASIAKLRFERERSVSPSAAPQRVSRSGRADKGVVVATIATLGAFGGMAVASRVALPCHCDDPESVVARGALIGGVAGAIAGIIITSR